ncbi:MAG: hypothetical protein WC496_00450 [Phycisphaerae bacterium]|jgi:hypothetical protein
MWNVFEYPFVGIAAAGVVMFGLWLLWILKPDKRRRWHPLIPLGIVALAFAVSYFVQTDKEKILNAINIGIKAFEEQKIEPIKEIIADDYADTAHSSKDTIIAYCQAMIQTAMIEKLTFLSRGTVVEDNHATFTMEALIKFSEESEIARMGKSFLIVKARFSFEKTPDKRWLINSSEILELDRKQVNWGELKG